MIISFIGIIFLYNSVSSSEITCTGPSSDLWYWINSQKNSVTHSFCTDKDSETTFDKKSSEKNLFVKGPFPCPEDGSFVEFQGQLNLKNLPNGNGRFHTLDRKNQPSSNLCFELPPNIEFISGTFVKGLLHGKTKIKYSDDNSYIEATFFKGVIHGKVRHFDETNCLFYVGLYQNGKPNGPFWFYYPDTEEPKLDQFTFVEFNNGEVMTEKVALLKNEENTGTYYLTKSSQI